MNAVSLSAGVLSTLISHPFEFLKMKTFLINEGIGITGRGFNMGYNPFTIYDNFLNRGYGSRVLYTGLSSALVSRVAFLFGRNNAYKLIYDQMKPHKKNNDLLYIEKGAISGVSSIVGSILSNYSMVKFVRQVGDIGRKPQFHRAAEPFRWNHGFLPYALRMFLLNTFLIWPYNSANEKLYVLCGDVISNRIFATLFAAGIGTLISVPIDAIRTRIQYMSSNPKLNRMQYKNLFDCIVQMGKNEGMYTFLAGMKVAYVHMVVYTLSTIYLCDLFVDSLKSK